MSLFTEVSDPSSIYMPTEWHQFEQVTAHIPQGPRRLFRSSAPNYSGDDSSQRLTQTAVNELVENGITRIISLNSVKYTRDELRLLEKANIAYLHLPVPDFTAPTLQQIHSAINMFSKAPASTTLVHCGYGHGRTGTMVTAIQLWQTNGHLNLTDTATTNHVERDSQREVLRCYQQELFHEGL